MLTTMAEGMVRTCGIFFLTLLFSLPLGMIIMLLRRSRITIVSSVIKVLLAIVRGTPLMLQLLVWYFGPYYLFGISIRGYRFPAIIIGFSVNYACYFAEIFRGGLLAVDVGQYEASKVLGLSRFQTMVRVIIPQMIRVSLPSVTNETITLLKDTALVTIIGVAEVLHYAKAAVNRDATPFAYLVAGLLYLLINFIITLVFKKLEEKFDF